MLWRQRQDLWLLIPQQPIGVIQFLGGSGLGATPQLSYRRLLEAMAQRGWLVQCWGYLPGFDHQLLAVQAWKAFRQQRQAGLPVLRLGHSMGCKLHLLAPDQGRGAAAEVLLSFNNFNAERSVPLLGELAPRLGVSTEFSPDPQQTLELIHTTLSPKPRLLIRFRSDTLDQSEQLLQVLPGGSSSNEQLLLGGDHLTPASAGLRQQLLGGMGDGARQQEFNRLAEAIQQWWQRRCSAAI